MLLFLMALRLEASSVSIDGRMVKKLERMSTKELNQL